MKLLFRHMGMTSRKILVQENERVLFYVAAAQERIAREVRSYRKTRGLSQRRVADKAGTTQAVISQIEARKYNPSVELLERVAQALGMRLEVAFRLKPKGYTYKE